MNGHRKAYESINRFFFQHMNGIYLSVQLYSLKNQLLYVY